MRHVSHRPKPRALASAFAAALLSAFATALPGAAQETGGDLAVYISADMEGITGAVTSEQLGPGGFEYARFREVVTEEVLTAVEAARAMGATRILVSDSHGNGQNLLIDRFPDDVEIVRSWPRPLMMVQGVQDGFDAALFIGYHSATTNERGVRAHTMSSANLTAVRLNGVEMGEAGINAAIAGHFGVPVVMISGDDAVVEETRSLLGDVEGAVVKESLGFHAARTLTPAAGRAEIDRAVRAALGRLGEFEPYRVEGRPELEISFKNYMPAEVLAYLPNVERVDAHTVRFVGEDMVEVSKFIEFVLTFGASISP